MTSISELPNEVIILLLSYLSLPDRKNARLVNKHWHELSYAAALVKEDITVLPSYSKLDHLNFKRRYFNIKIKNLLESGERSYKFWEKCGKDIKSIEMYLVDGRSDWLGKIFVHTPNLEYLFLSACDENDQASIVWRHQPVTSSASLDFSFPKLLSLDLIHMKLLTGDHFRALVKNAPKLKRLSLEWLNKIWPEDLSVAVEEFTGRQGANLKELNFGYCVSLNPESFRSIISNIGPQLTGLYLRKCQGLNDDSLLIIKNRLPNLKEIDLSMCPFSDEGLCKLFEALKCLTHISLTKTLVGEKTIPLLRSMSQLRAIELSDCKFMPLLSLQEVFTQQDFLKLSDLRLDKARITDAIIIDMVEHFPNLIFLYLNCCKALTDIAVEHISMKCRKLRCLSLQNCSKIKDISEVNRLKGLIHLDLYGCSKVTESSIALLKLLELQSIDLSSTNVTRGAFETAASNCPSLQDVCLDIHMEKELRDIKKSNKYSFRFHFGLTRFTADSIFDN